MSSEISISLQRNNDRTCHNVTFNSVLATNIQIVYIYNSCKLNIVGLYRFFPGTNVFVVDKNLMVKENLVVCLLNH